MRSCYIRRSVGAISLALGGRTRPWDAVAAVGGRGEAVGWESPLRLRPSWALLAALSAGGASTRSTRSTQRVHAGGVRATDGAPSTARRGLATSPALRGQGEVWRARASADREGGGRAPDTVGARLGGWPGGGTTGGASPQYTRRRRPGAVSHAGEGGEIGQGVVVGTSRRGERGQGVDHRDILTWCAEREAFSWTHPMHVACESRQRVPPPGASRASCRGVRRQMRCAGFTRGTARNVTVRAPLACVSFHIKCAGHTLKSRS